MAELWKSEGKSFIITGGSTGLGAAYAEAFLEDGAKNIAILDIAEEAGDALTQKLNKIYGNKTIFMKCDVSNEEDISRAFEDVLNEFKQVDVLINNAGVMNDAEHIWRKACDINWQGLVSLTRKNVSHMRKDEGGAGGTIVNVSSIAGFLKLPFIPAYAGSKAAVLHFSMSLADPPFYDKTGVRILTLCPGPTRTPLMEQLGDKSIDRESAVKVEDYSTYQLVDSVVEAMRKMLREGQNSSIWLTANNRPGEDITKFFIKNHEELLNIVMNGLDPKDA